MKVLITDGHYKHALAAVRSLGRKGIDVGVLSNKKNCLCFYSKYCKEKHYDNYSNQADFIDFLDSILSTFDYTILLPIGYKTTVWISKNQHRIKDKINVSIAPSTSMDIASDKRKTMEYAKKIGIPHPKTYIPTDIDDVKKISRNISFPAVIKVSLEGLSVQYAHNANDLIKKYELIQHQVFNSNNEVIFQEFIPGKGYGFYGLYKKGKLQAFFCHRRIHELPPSGGASTMASSFYDEPLREYGDKILSSLKWNGVAMVEFKKDTRDDLYKIIEINPKYWGSLDLAIESGVDFPYLHCLMIQNKTIPDSILYNQELTFRWLIPDLQRALMTKTIAEYLSLFSEKTVKSDFHRDDLKPLIIQSTILPIINKIIQ